MLSVTGTNGSSLASLIPVIFPTALKIALAPVSLSMIMTITRSRRTPLYAALRHLTVRPGQKDRRFLVRLNLPSRQ